MSGGHAASATFESLLRTITPSSSEDGLRYAIGGQLGSVFVARDPDGAPCLLIPIENAPAGIGRRTKGVTLKPDANLQYDFGGRSWVSDSAVLTCGSPSLNAAFAALSDDVAREVSAVEPLPSWRDVQAAFHRWEELLASARALDETEQIGLWGELWVIADAPDVDLAIEAWRGPKDDPVDFFCSGRGLEVKTTRKRLVHFVSQSQVDSPQGDFPVFLASLWIDVDPASGLDLPALVDRIRDRGPRGVTFEEKLLQAGYSDEDGLLYQKRFVLLEDPLLFPEETIPRIRHADEGVSHIRYRIELDEEFALDTSPSRSLSCDYWAGTATDNQPRRNP